jgi:hypothetical protein
MKSFGPEVQVMLPEDHNNTLNITYMGVFVKQGVIFVLYFSNGKGGTSNW